MWIAGLTSCWGIKQLFALVVEAFGGAKALKVK